MASTPWSVFRVLAHLNSKSYYAIDYSKDKDKLRFDPDLRYIKHGHFIVSLMCSGARETVEKLRVN